MKDKMEKYEIANVQDLPLVVRVRLHFEIQTIKQESYKEVQKNECK